MFLAQDCTITSNFSMMKKYLIYCMMLTILILCSCTTVRTYKVQGVPGSKVSLQSVDRLSETILDANGDGKIQWVAEKGGNSTELPTYLVSMNKSSLIIPIGMDYRRGNANINRGGFEVLGGFALEGATLGVALGTSCPPAVPIILSAGCLYCFADGIPRISTAAADAVNDITFLPIHTNDDMTFSMEPSRPSGEPKMKRISNDKPTKKVSSAKSKIRPSSKIKNEDVDDKFFHTVEEGEKLSDIATTYGISVSEIIRANKLRSNNVKKGQKLIIPMNP